MENYIKGQYTTIYKTKGIKYKLYVPENVNADTPVFIYAYGAGDPNIEKCISEQGSDSIIIGTCIDFNADIGPITMDIVNEVKQKYGVTSTIVSTSSFSLGGSVIYEMSAENIRQNPECEPQTVFLIDAYGTYFYNPKLHLNDTETMNLFKENNTIFFAFDHPDKSTNVNTQYAQAGLNLITVKCVGQNHGEINTSVFADGLYDYRTNEKLPKDGYIYSIYNADTGRWEEVPYEKIATLSDIYSLFGIKNDEIIEHKYTLQEMANLEDLSVTSDSGVLEESLNKIRSTIRNSNIVNGSSIGGCSSTTMMPSQIGAVVSRFLESTTSCLSKIVNETSQFAAIGESIEELNFNLERQAMEIDNIDIIESIYGPTSSVTEEDVKQEYMTVETVQPPINEIPVDSTVVESTKESVNSISSNVDIKSNTTVSDPKSEIGTPTVVPPSNSVSTNSGNKDTSNGENKVNSSTLLGHAIGTVSGTIANNSSNTNKVVVEQEEVNAYDNLLSNDKQLVYEYGEGCKLVIYRDGDTILGVEHHFDLSKNNMSLEDIESKYSQDIFFSKLIKRDNYVKVILNCSMYGDRTITDIRNILDFNNEYKLV